MSDPLPLAGLPLAGLPLAGEAPHLTGETIARATEAVARTPKAKRGDSVVNKVIVVRILTERQEHALLALLKGLGVEYISF